MRISISWKDKSGKMYCDICMNEFAGPMIQALSPKHYCNRCSSPQERKRREQIDKKRIKERAEFIANQKAKLAKVGIDPSLVTMTMEKINVTSVNKWYISDWSNHPVKVIGPFNSKEEATDYVEQNRMWAYDIESLEDTNNPEIYPNNPRIIKP